MTLVRRAGPLDARPMARMLEALHAAGDQAAAARPVSAETLRLWLSDAPERTAWHLAEDRHGTCLGVQWIGPGPDLPPEACEIATFVRPGAAALGVGTRLLDRTRVVARALGYRWIDATPRADNESARTYYQSRGFELRAILPCRGHEGPGRVAVRYDLD